MTLHALPLLFVLGCQAAEFEPDGLPPQDIRPSWGRPIPEAYWIPGESCASDNPESVPARVTNVQFWTDFLQEEDCVDIPVHVVYRTSPTPVCMIFPRDCGDDAYYDWFETFPPYDEPACAPFFAGEVPYCSE